MVDLAVSIVTYAPDSSLLEETLKSLNTALVHAQEHGTLQSVKVTLVDNGPNNSWKVEPQKFLEIFRHPESFISTEFLSGHGNIGFGAGHNLAAAEVNTAYHLVLNPDVIVDKHAVSRLFSFVKMNKMVGLVSPLVHGQDGEQEFLCKRYPSLFNLGLRGFAPTFTSRLFRNRLATYEMRDECAGNEVVFDIPIVSGCFMFIKDKVWQSLEGFSPEFFLYFEDFDFSIRAGKISSIAYVPSVKIIHHGGNAAKKGKEHIYFFVCSALKFFSIHGWKFF